MRYLEQWQVLDSKTLLVHAVHLGEADWEIVIRNHCPVCFCPRSNRNLNVGRPDIAKALRHGVVTALGTDSLASNTDLNLFSEAAYVFDHYSDVPPEATLLMITLGGARALGQEQEFGSIEPGKRANLLAVSLPVSFPSHRLFEMIIHQGNKGALQWAYHPVPPRRDYD
jgi:cytosine/adenosine deaminase-related metal-dependent hydrolase